MKEPRRLLETEAGPALALLQAGAREHPGAQVRRKITAAAISAASVATATAAAGATGAAVASKVGWLTILAWFGAGAMAATVLLTGIALRAPSASPSAAAPLLGAPASAPVAATTEVSSHLPLPPLQTTPSTPVLPPFNRPAPSASSSPAVAASSALPPPRADTVGLEVVRLDRARRALADGDPQRALRELDERERATGSGALALEAQVLRIEALLRKGDHAAAGSLAEQFLREHGDSQYAPRVRSLLQAANNP